MILGIVLGFLQATVKNAKSLVKERIILTEIRDEINNILKGTD